MKKLQQRREADNRAQTSHRREEEASPEEMEVGYKQEGKWKSSKKFNRTRTSRGGGDFLYPSYLLFYSLISHHSFLSVLSTQLPIPNFRNSHFGTDLSNTDRFFKVLPHFLLKILRII
jgi:hypothetical protein